MDNDNTQDIIKDLQCTRMFYKYAEIAKDVIQMIFPNENPE